MDQATKVLIFERLAFLKLKESKQDTSEEAIHKLAVEYAELCEKDEYGLFASKMPSNETLFRFMQVGFSKPGMMKQFVEQELK